MFPLPVAMEVPEELVFKAEWWYGMVPLPVAMEVPEELVFKAEWWYGMFPLLVAMKVPGKLVFKVGWYGMFPLPVAMKAPGELVYKAECLIPGFLYRFVLDMNYAQWITSAENDYFTITVRGHWFLADFNKY